MRIMVTGGCGFIGLGVVKHLLQHATANSEIIIVDHLGRHGRHEELEKILQNPAVRLIQMDISDRERLFQLNMPIDRVYHLAAMIGVERSTKNPSAALKTNTLATLNILEWFALHHNADARFLFSSSSEVYAGGVELMNNWPVPTPEAVPMVIPDINNPRFSYALSKIWGEAWTNYAARELGYFTINVRYHNIYGPAMGYDHVIPQVISRIKKREKPFRLVAGEQTRSFCWIDDAAAATRKIMEAPQIAPGTVVHIGNQKGEIEIAQLYEKIFSLCDWRPAETLKEAAPAGSVARRCPDVSLLKKLTGFHTWTDLDSGLKPTVQWYLNHPGVDQ